MTDPHGFAKLVPGYEFLQNLVQNAGNALPQFGQWVAPTLNPQDLDKRIEELRTVQFWLEQNARLLGATIQAMEVQRMTLSTLQTMNVQMDDLREAMSAPLAAGAGMPADPAAPATPPPAASSPRSSARRSRAETPSPKPEWGRPTPAVDPAQWWGALTQQFTELAASAMKTTSAQAASKAAADMTRHAFDFANQSLKPSPAPAKKSAAGKTAPAKKTPARKRAPSARNRS